MEELTTTKFKECEGRNNLYGYAAQVRRMRLPLQLNMKTLNYFLASLILIVSISYFVASNHLISQGFAINEIKNSVQDLKKNNRDLELIVMNLESYKGLQERIQELEMVSVNEIDYIEFKNENVAMAD
ncbi:MAG: hypothetical protein ABIH48_02720 [Candidatus Falkowbacteria bacterium]